MKIQSRVSTEIVLNQNEIEEAIIEFVKGKAGIVVDSEFKIAFDDSVQGGDLTATVNINSVLDAPPAPITKQVTRRQSKATTETATAATVAPETAAAKEINTFIANATLATKVPTTAEELAAEPKPEITASPEDRKDPEVEVKADETDPPFDPDTPATEEPKTTPKIFSTTATSAPVMPPPPEPDPTTKAKSLFANLSPVR